MASLTLRCPQCGQDVALPATVVTSDVTRSMALVNIDQSVARAHFAQCQKPAEGKPTTVRQSVVPVVSRAELAGRINRLLDMRAYVGTGGSRACTMCGVNGQDCLAGMQGGEPGKPSGVPCCAACGNGDTHPVPKGSMSCAAWGAEYGAKS